MSTYLGRIRRVHTGWRAMPGKNLVVFDDALVEARASALDGLAVTGLGVTGRGQRVAAEAGSRRNQDLDTADPAALASQHPANWMIPTSAVTSATLSKPRLTRLWGVSRRLTLQTSDGVRTVDWEGQANPDAPTITMLTQALGDRFQVAGKND